MIIDSIQNAKNYYPVHTFFEKAFDYITQEKVKEIEPGKYDIEADELRAIISNKEGVSLEKSLAKFECHNKHIDIQYCISGKETFGWKPREKCVEPNEGYNDDRDVQFYNDQPDTYFDLHPGQFVVFFPNDVHAPMIGTGVIHKMVIKVKI